MKLPIQQRPTKQEAYDSLCNDLREILVKLMSQDDGSSYYLFGSSATVNPPVIHTDIDVALFGISDKALQEVKAKREGKGYPDSPFVSWRWEQPSGEFSDRLFGPTVNFIQFFDLTTYHNHRLAAGLCKFLNLKERRQRIAVFDAVAKDDTDDYLRELISLRKTVPNVI